MMANSMQAQAHVVATALSHFLICPAKLWTIAESPDEQLKVQHPFSMYST
jgi:hypothetical protein